MFSICSTVEGGMMVWLKDTMAGVGLTVFMACGFVLAHAAHLAIAAS